MSTETAEAPAKEFDAPTKELGDKLVGLTLLQAKALADYLKEVHGIEPAGGGVMVAAPAAAGGGEAAAVEEKTEFDVVLTSFGDVFLKLIMTTCAIGIKKTQS